MVLPSQRHLINTAPAVAVRVQFDSDVECERCGAEPAAWHCMGEFGAVDGHAPLVTRVELCVGCYGELSALPLEAVHAEAPR